MDTQEVENLFPRDMNVALGSDPGGCQFDSDRGCQFAVVAQWKSTQAGSRGFDSRQPLQFKHFH